MYHNVKTNLRFDKHLTRGGESMDDTDRQLIGLLRNDARASVASLAKALRVARGTVQNRMARLAANGTILGYTVRLKPDVEEPRMRAFMTVAVGRCTRPWWRGVSDRKPRARPR